MVRIRIETTIFFLAVSLLCLTVALTAFATLQTDQVVKENDRIWSRYIPLHDTLDDFDVDSPHRHANTAEGPEARHHEIGTGIEAVLNGAGLAACARVNGLVRITVASTSFAVHFGLVFAWLVSRRRVQPVQILMSGVRSVEQGDLTIQIPINSSDEIGLLTGSFNKMVSDLRSKQQLKETFGEYIDPPL